MSTKRFNIMYNIAKAKYVVNYHDGIKKHNDGSDFFDIAVFNNKRKFQEFIIRLTDVGYVETKG